jgi:hypothetical protein
MIVVFRLSFTATFTHISVHALCLFFSNNKTPTSGMLAIMGTARDMKIMDMPLKLSKMQICLLMGVILAMGITNKPSSTHSNRYNALHGINK